MKFKELFEKWEFSSLKLNAKFVEAEFIAKPEDQEAAWEMYVELVTRVLTQELKDVDGDEETALNSVHSLFGITRDILKRKTDYILQIVYVTDRRKQTIGEFSPFCVYRSDVGACLSEASLRESHEPCRTENNHL